MLIAIAALAALIGLASPASAQSSSRVKCESRNYQPNACPVYGARDVQMVDRQGGDCRPGIDWFYDGSSINVRNGCRGIFNVIAGNYGGGGGNYGGSYPGQTIRCESRDYQPARCAMDTRYGVQLKRQYGGVQCIEGRNWGSDRSGVWVSQGCRADFTSASNSNGGWNGGNAASRSIDCNSRDYKPARCNTPVPSTVVIERVLGGECIQGRTWGWDRNGVWVNDGCRGRFRIY